MAEMLIPNDPNNLNAILYLHSRLISFHDHIHSFIYDNNVTVFNKTFSEFHDNSYIRNEVRVLSKEDTITHERISCPFHENPKGSTSYFFRHNDEDVLIQIKLMWI